MKSITIRLSEADHARAEQLARVLEGRARESGLGLVMRGNGVPVGRIMQDAAVLGLSMLCEQYGVQVEDAGGPSTLVSTQPSGAAYDDPDFDLE